MDVSMVELFNSPRVLAVLVDKIRQRSPVILG